MSTKKNLCYVIVVLIFFAVFSMGSGCGDTKNYYGSEYTSGSGSSGGTTDDETATDDDSSSGTAANINGTWEIIDGKYSASYDDGRTMTGTYVQGSIDTFQIEVKKGTLGYAIILTGKNIYMSGTEVAMLRPTFKNDTSNSTFRGTFITMPMFTLSGKSSYVIDGTTDETAKLNVGLSKITITLESDSTLLWTYWAQGNPNTMGSLGDTEVYQEITLRRVK